MPFEADFQKRKRIGGVGAVANVGGIFLGAQYGLSVSVQEPWPLALPRHDEATGRGAAVVLLVSIFSYVSKEDLCGGRVCVECQSSDTRHVTLNTPSRQAVLTLALPGGVE